jgi:hypothetical protein
MDRRYLVVACGMTWQTMNAWGVMTFACLGASFGCLMAEPAT